MQNKPNFQNAQMNVSIFSQMAYEYKSNWTLGENKPNSKPIKPKTNPISKRPKIDVNIYYTKLYNNETAFRRRKNKPNSNPIQTQSKPVLSAACPERSRMGRMGQFLQKPKWT